MLIRLLIFSAFVLAVNLIAGIFAKELESDVEGSNQDDSSRMLHLTSSQYVDSFGTGDISHSLKKPKINKRFAKDEENREENTTEHRKVRKSISFRRRLQRNKSNEESLLAQESSHVLGATAQPETTTSRSNNDTASEEKSTEEKETLSSLNETKTTTESTTTVSASPSPRKRTRPPITRTEAPSVPLAAAAAAALTMSESLYNHFRPLDKDVPEDHLLPFLDFGRKLIPSSKTSTSPLTKSSSSSSSTSSTNSIESATVTPSRSPSSLSATRYHASVHRKSNASVNSPSETTIDVRATTPREEEVHEDMDVSVVKATVEKNKAPRGRGGSAQFLRNLGGLYRKQDVSSTTTIVVTPAEGNATESTTVASQEAVNQTNVSDSDLKENISLEDQLARAQELRKYTITTKRTYSAKLVSTENDLSASETATYRSVNNATASTSTSSKASASSKQSAASSSVIEATLASPFLEKKRNVTSFMLLNRRPPLRGISVNRHNVSRNSSDETKSNSVSSRTVNQTLVPSEDKSESLNISRGKMSFKLLPQNPNKDYQAKRINATQTDFEATKTTPNLAPNVSDVALPQSSTTETIMVTSSPPSPTTKILSTAVVTSVSVKGAWPSSAVTNLPLPEPTLAPPDSQQSVVTSENPSTPSSPKDIPHTANNSMIPTSEEILIRRTKNLTFPESVFSKQPPATTVLPNSSIPSSEVNSMASSTEQISTTTSTISTTISTTSTTTPTTSTTKFTTSTTSTTLKPRTTTLTGKLGSRRRIQSGVSSIAKHSSFSNNSNETGIGGSPTSTTQSSVVFTRSSKSPSHFRFPVFTTTRAPWRPSSTTTRSTSTSAATTSTDTTPATADLLPKVVFSTPRNQPTNTTLVSDFPSSTSFPPSSAETSPVSVRTITDTSEFDLPLWRLYNASTVLFPSSPGIKPAVTTVDSKQTPQEPAEMEEAVVRKEVRNDTVSEVQNNTLENVTEGVIIGASEVRPSPGVGVIVYVTAAVAIVPAIIIVALATKYLLNRRKKLLDDSDAYSDISSRRDAVTSSCQQSESDLGSPTSGTKLPRVPTHLTWDQEKPANPGNGVTSSNWEFPRSKLRLQTVLGQGNFGQVLKAEADDICGHQGMTRLVAVKTVKEGASAREKDDLLRELEIMQHLGSHTNVVTLLGCCTEKEPYLLIMEYVMYGKLLTFLRDHRTRQHYFNFSEDSDALTSRDLLVFAYCVARGMEYLTSKGIVHRDLAARNVLVDHNKLCKIADFGMSRNVREMGDVYEQRHSKGALPIRWMAPESLIYRIFTHKSDVWSFGILMWEIVTLGSTPYPQMGAREVMRRVCDGYRLERPSHCRMELFRIISWCWSADPNKRLDFSELKRELGVLLENSKNGTGYVDLESFEESKYNYSKTPVISHRHHHHHHHHHHQQQSSPSNHHSSPATATLRSIGDAEEIVVNM